MDRQTTFQIKIDDRYNSYRSFFDHQWAKEVSAVSEAYEKLDRELSYLLLGWKSVSRAAGIPAMAVDFAEQFAVSSRSLRLSNSLTMQLVFHLAERIEQKFSPSSMDKKELVKFMFDSAENLFKSTEEIGIDFPKQEIWYGIATVQPNEEINNPKYEFRFALWASQRLSYSALYFYYEDFLNRVLRIRSGKPNLGSGTALEKNAIEIFGEPLAEFCLKDKDVVAARLIRNSLAHHGGRETSVLLAINHGIEVVDGVLQILPEDVQGLFELLKLRCNAIVNWAVDFPEFS